MASIKAKVDGAVVLLDDMQLEEEEPGSVRYTAIAGVKEMLQEAVKVIEGRLDLIQKVDNSKVGWSAAVHYEKSNGPLVKDESGKLWEEAEKKVVEAKKTAAREGFKTPFRVAPVGSGRNQSYQKSSSRG